MGSASFSVLKIYGALLAVILSAIYSVSYSQTGKSIAPRYAGRYKAINGNCWIINSDGSFCLLQGRRAASDVEVSSCDTLAHGRILSLAPNSFKIIADEKKIDVSIKGENKGSQDSLYIEVVVPNDDFSFAGRYRYTAFSNTSDTRENTTGKIVLQRRKQDNMYLTDRLTLFVQDLYPENVDLYGKCYQRISFFVLDNKELDNRYNYFKIVLSNFTCCYVKQSVVNNTIAVINNNTFYWADGEYLKQ